MSGTLSASRPRRDYLAAADLLRVFAVGLVACFHIWQQSWLDPGFRIAGVYFDLQRIIRRGYMGVDLMLLLSGFLLYLPAAKSGKMPDTLTFYKKRMVRILPSYLFALAVCTGFALVYGPDWGSAPLGRDLLAHLTFTHTFWRGTYMWTSLNVALWTLAVEVQFYLLFPLIGRAFQKKPWLTWALMTAIALGCRRAVTPLPDISMLFNQLPCMLDLYAFGMLAAHLLSRREPGERRWPFALGSLLCLAGIVWVLWKQNPVTDRELNQLQMNWRPALAALGAGFLWCGGQWGPAFSRAVGNPLTRWCAAVSYNFYIWHQYLAVKLKLWHIPPYTTTSGLPQMDEGQAWRVRYTAICFAAAFAAATILTYGLERPAARALSVRKRIEKTE